MINPDFNDDFVLLHKDTDPAFFNTKQSILFDFGYNIQFEKFARNLYFLKTQVQPPTARTS